MKLDEARKKTDKELEDMERRLTEIYEQAQKEITEKWNAYMERGEKRLSALRESGDIKAYQQALGSYTLQNQRYKEMIAQTTERLAHVNDIALAYINDQMPSIYALNYDQSKEVADQIGISFNLVDESTVKRLVRDGDVQLPKKKMDIPKDQRWNTKQLNSSLLQGILQGESMDKIAKRILPIVDNNRKAAIRNARTMVTGAENRGRLDSYKQLENDGLILNKVWMATPDGRTRDWHVDMDGQEVPIDQYFIDGLGNELEYPGDPMGAPESVYNCRCTMITNVQGFRHDDGSVSMIDYEPEEETLHDVQMREEKARRSSKEQKPEQPQKINEFANKEKERLDNLSGGKLGIELDRTGMFDRQELLSAMKNGTLDEYKDEYIRILNENGDVTIKGDKTTENGSGKSDIPRENMENEIRSKAVASGMSEDEINKMFNEASKFFSGEWDRANSEYVDKFIELTATYDGVIQRGLHFDTRDAFDSFMNGIEKGSVIGMDGKNSSWTSDMAVARRYSHMGDDFVNSVILVCDKNVTASATCQYSGYSDEEEVTALSSARWTVTKVDLSISNQGAGKATIHVIERTNQ